MSLGLSSRNDYDPEQVTVDRIVPAEGYVTKNMVLCCLWVNNAKGQGTIEELKDRVRGLLKV
jgi:hypothetical protein